MLVAFSVAYFTGYMLTALPGFCLVTDGMPDQMIDRLHLMRLIGQEKNIVKLGVPANPLKPASDLSVMRKT